MILMHRCRDAARAIEACTELHALGFPQSYWDKDAFTRLIANPTSAVYLTWEEQAPTAMLLMHTHPDEAEILTFCVRPSHQKQGFGEALLQFSESDLKATDIKRFFLEVAADNMAALCLYRKLGYSEINRRMDYYGIGQDAMMMEKLLTR